MDTMKGNLNDEDAGVVYLLLSRIIKCVRLQSMRDIMGCKVYERDFR